LTSSATAVQAPPSGYDALPESIRDLVVASGSRNIRRHWVRNAIRVTVLVAADVVTVSAVRAVIAAAVLGSLGPDVARFAGWAFPIGIVLSWTVVPAVLLGLVFAGAYGAGDRRRDTARVVTGATLAGLFTLYAFVWTGAWVMVGRELAATIAVLSSGVMVSRWAVDRLVSNLGPLFGPSRVIIVGDTSLTLDPTAVTDRVFAGAALSVVGSVGVVDDGGEPTGPPVTDLGRLIHETHADTVIVRRPLAAPDFEFVVDQALASGCRLLAGARTTRATAVEPRSVWLNGEAFVELTTPHLKAWQLAMKRSIDFLGAAAGLVVLSPLLALIAVWVKLDSPGPVVFGHNRLGVKGRTFRCYKFRSMHQDAERMLRANPELYRTYVENHFKLPPEIDPRLTRAGRFLRATSLDELPQLVNVLLGQMSLVGPRPIVPAELDHYGKCAPLFLSLKPGITGMWAVSGRSRVGYPQRAQMELEYVRCWSLIADLALLARTVPAVLGQRGAH